MTIWCVREIQRERKQKRRREEEKMDRKETDIQLYTKVREKKYIY